MGFLRKLKIRILYDPAIPLLGMHPDKNTGLVTKFIFH